LEDALQRRFVQDPKALKGIFKKGLLHEFSTKVALGYLLQIYSEEAKKNLEAIGKIRNEFAHNLAIGSFEHSDLKLLFRDLTLYHRCEPGDKPEEFFLPEPLPQNASRRQRFICNVHCLNVYFVLDSFREKWELPEPFF